MLDTFHEVAIYLHRFHNLDLFQQGWYQIKISLKWEDGDGTYVGIPSRVVQYEAPSMGSDDSYGVWRIDDSDNSFSTQPFKIRYARQDVPLSVMVAFNLSLSNREIPAKSGVIIKFELIYSALLEKGSELQASLSTSAAAVHEFRIPPKALLGLHSYCPVLFDAFHSVLVDVSIHISLLKTVAQSLQKKVPRTSFKFENIDGKVPDKSIKGFGKVVKEVLLVKSLLTARDILLEEAQKLGKAIDQSIDFTEFISQMDDTKLFDSLLQADVSSITSDVKNLEKSDSQKSSEKASLFLDFRSNGALQSLSRDSLLYFAHTIGNQIHYLWNTFLNFHRANKTKVMEYLRESWANDRRTEWSIWMVHSKVEMPHHFISSRSDEASLRGGLRGKVAVLRKLADDPAQIAATRAELHRRSIAQMKINSRSIQDLHMFGDPSSVPVVIVERVINAPRRSSSGNSYFEMTPSTLLSELPNKISSGNHLSNGRSLKLVVFVHGFQGHHLDLRLVRNQWLLLDPKIEFLMSEANEDKTSGDFREMGKRLAKEVASFVSKKRDKAFRSGGVSEIKLSFVGHSIGNVIIRAALADNKMESCLKYLHTYVSVSGPHLGYLYSSNSLFNSGLWLLKKLKSTQCIHQLTLTDDPDLQNTFFFKLCQQKTLEKFKNIILLSSPQDGYVPYHSARIELCPASSTDFSKRGQVFVEMLNNCLDQIRSPSMEHRVFMRCDVNFNMSSHGKNLNTFIGRAAHIEFLETDIFAKLIMWPFPEFFR
ncbi:protein FAM135A-like isoform X2 [Chenopodium quinoa]|nr:protein FAM135A-like isoform X2 [Chenopodium quinoa]